MPMVFTSISGQSIVLRKPPSHFLFDTESDLISKNAVEVYRKWLENISPQQKTRELKIEEILEFGEAVDRMTLWQTIDGGSDYFVLYHGSEIGRIFGEGTRTRLSTTDKTHFKFLIEIAGLVQSSGAVVVNGPALNAVPERLYMVSQSLFMPAHTDDNRVKQILVYSDYFTDGKVEKK